MGRKMRRTFRGLAAVLLLGLWGCPPPDEPVEERPGQEGERWEPALEDAPGGEARAEMVDHTGESAGTLTLTSVEEGVRVQGQLHIPGVPPGEKGFHVHEVGECEPPDFESAGPHFDPHDHPHGDRDDPPTERHTGDLGNVEIDAEGMVEIDLVDEVIELGPGPDDVLGRAIIVHAERDDLETQPDGDAGDPVACGVIESRDQGAADEAQSEPRLAREGESASP